MPILLLLLFLIFFLFAPAPSRRQMRTWRGTIFAHRGLHGEGIPENTIPAFRTAVEHNYGIELDVRLSRDGKVIVFHDDDLRRMANDPRTPGSVSYQKLSQLPLNGGEGRIPLFQDVLRAVDGQVPLLVEIKNGKDWRMLCERTMAQLKTYKGEVLIESFNPLIVAWLRRNHPEYRRGQLVGRPVSYLAAHMGWPGALLLSSLALNFLSRPDFIAYDISAGRLSAPRLNRGLFHGTNAVWTVRDMETLRGARERGDMVIFEGIVP